MSHDPSPKKGTSADASGPMSAWAEHLAHGLADAKRKYTFDIEEEKEAAQLAHFPILAEAIRFFDSEVKPDYEKADETAQKRQTTHRWLACFAIIGGSLAIIFAILQLALKHSWPELSDIASLLEAGAVMAAVPAVVMGVIAKVNHQWFIRRHIAERLRMLKFQALGRPEFWRGDLDAWKTWMKKAHARISRIATIEEVTAWEKGGAAEPDEPPVPACLLGDSERLGAATYYRYKRVRFQARYFETQSRKFAEETHWLHRLSFPIFVASIIAVVLHFAADSVAHRSGDAAAMKLWEEAGTWALVSAALLPVVGFGARAWIGAFERTRSSRLYEDKRRELMKTFEGMAHDGGDCAATMHHIAHVEHCLENEHREWLRLLIEAEWFL